MSIGDLATATNGGPSIVGSVVNHSVVVDKVDNGVVYIRDPLPEGLGSAYTVSVADFLEWWNGSAVVPAG